MLHSVLGRRRMLVARLGGLGIMAVTLLVAAAPAMADPPARCTGTLPPGTYSSIIVPSGSSCTVANSNVSGDVIAQSGAAFLNVLNTNIGGSYIAHSGYAGLCCSTVHQHVIIDGTTSATQIYGSTIDGNADMVNASGAYAVVNYSTILGNLNFTNNSAGYNEVDNNTIDNNLICENNSPPPLTGGNIVGGNSNGQCSS